ncbi:major capsid protein [Bacillus phage Silence]|nr:major capsid protein [Bacillus phage Silence]
MPLELKDLQVEIQKSFDQLKKAGEDQAAEIKKYGDATAETKTTIAGINKEITDLKTQIDDIATKANRVGVEGGQAQTPEQKAASDAFFKFVREGKAGLDQVERKALVEDTTGEIIVPEALDSEVYRELGKLTVMRQLAGVRNTSSNRVRRRSLNELTVGWGKLETTSKKLGDFESTLVPDDDYIYIEDALGLTKVGEDELEDTDLNLSSYIADSFGQAMSELEDLGFLKGTGHANNQPEGILNGTKITRFGTAAANSFTADDAIKVAYQVPAQYRQRGSYLVNSQTELAMRLMKGSDGQYLWQPSLQAGTPATFNGRPVYNVDNMDSGVTTGKELMVFGDFASAYRIYDRKGGMITRINELYIEDGLVGFKYKRRVGGGIVRPNALRVLKVQ